MIRMEALKRLFSALLLVSFSTISAHAAAVVQVSSGPQDGAHSLALLMVTPSPGSPGDFQNPSQFALHDHGYLSPGVPDPARAYVLFEFDSAVVVDSITVIQHTNGITRLRHSFGDAVSGLVSGSTALSGVYGDLTGNASMVEFGPDSFSFADGGAGRFHQFVVGSTNHREGWATYRFYLSFHAAQVPEVSQLTLMIAGLLLLGMVSRGVRRA